MKQLLIGTNPEKAKNWEICKTDKNCTRHVHLDKLTDGTTFEDWDNNKNLTISEITTRLSPLNKFPRTAPIVVQFKGGYYYPSELVSYRGDYSELCITPDTKNTKTVTVGEFYNQLKNVIGKELTGWKGGEFHMTGWTPVWVDYSGEYNQQAVVNVKLIDGIVVLLTKEMEY